MSNENELDLSPDTASEGAILSRRQYRQRIARLRRRYAWTRRYALRPAPGHLSLLDRVLGDLEAFLPPDLLIKVRLNVSGLAGNELQISLVLPGKGIAQDFQRSALVMIRHAQEESHLVCAACGSYMLKESANYRLACDSHPSLLQLRFAEDFAIYARREAKAEADRVTDAKPKAPDKPAPAATSGGVPLNGLPKIVLLQSADVDRFEKNNRNRYREGDRARGIAERIRAAGNEARHLGVIPEDWSAFIDEFERMFPNFREFAELLRDRFALSALGDRRAVLPRVLFVGPAGIGKTEAANWLAERLELPFRVVDFATAQTHAVLSGSDAFWSNTREGAVFEALAYEHIANPVFVLDELDKVSARMEYNPQGSLYALLESRSARRFVDASIRDIPIDASHVNWLATANDAASIPLPILSRFTVMQIAAPSPKQAEMIAQTIYARLRADGRWGEQFPEALSDAVKARLRDVPPRAITNLLARAFGAAARAQRREIVAADIRDNESTLRKRFGFVLDQVHQ